MVKLSGVSRQTLINWWNDPVKIRRFKCVAHGCVKVKNDPTITLEEV
jgi:hypothetical protein